MSALGLLLAVVTLVGLWVRRRVGLCPSFAAYLGLSLLLGSLTKLWSDASGTLQLWMVQQASLTLLQLFVLVELSDAAMAGFPRARRVTRSALAGLGIALVGVTAASLMFRSLPLHLATRLEYGIDLACAIALIAIYPYRSALIPIQRMILLGLFLNLGVSVAADWAFGAFGIAFDHDRTALYLAAHCATLALWAWAAWATRDGSAGALTSAP